METNEVELLNNMIAVLKQHGSIGFIGTFVSHDGAKTDCLTVSMVGSMYDNTLFKMVERQLSDIVLKVFEAKMVGREDASLIDPDFFKTEQDEK